MEITTLIVNHEVRRHLTRLRGPVNPLVDALRKTGISGRLIAAAVGVSPSRVSAWAHGAPVPRRFRTPLVGLLASTITTAERLIETARPTAADEMGKRLEFAKKTLAAHCDDFAEVPAEQVLRNEARQVEQREAKESAREE